MLASCHIPPWASSQLSRRGLTKTFRIPPNYRAISLLSNVAKLFEKLILARLMSDGISINPLQGRFRAGYSSIHSAFIFQEAVQSLRDLDTKAFLDVKKAFDTVWHEGLFVKLHWKGIHPRIWHLLINWYSHSSSSCYLLNGERSRVFRIRQGVRQGAILSPLLYSVYVDDFLAQLDDGAIWLALSTVHPPCMQMTSHLSPILMTTCSLSWTLYRGMQVPGATRLTLLSLRSWSSGNLLDPALLVVNLVLSRCAQSLYKNVTVTPIWASYA